MDGRDKDLPQMSQPGCVGQPKIPEKKKPSYKKMINDAIVGLQEKQGSSKLSIVKFISNNYPVGRGSSTRINSMLSRMVKERHLIQARGKNGVFRLNSRKPLTPLCSAGPRRKRSSSRRRGSDSKRRKGKKGKKRKGRKGKKGKKRKGKKGKRSKRKKRSGRKKGKRGKRKGKKRKNSKTDPPQAAE